jgi:hypothetical protein
MTRLLCLLRGPRGFPPENRFTILAEQIVGYGEIVVVGSGTGQVTFIHWFLKDHPPPRKAKHHFRSSPL